MADVYKQTELEIPNLHKALNVGCNAKKILNLNYSSVRLYHSEYVNDKGDFFKKLILYYVFREKELIGHFYFLNDEIFYVFNGQKNEIKILSRSNLETIFEIIDSENQKQIGRIIIPRKLKTSFQPYFYNANQRYPTIEIQDCIYIFKRVDSEIEYSFFDSETWGFDKFIFIDNLKKTKVTFSSKVENPVQNETISKYDCINIEIDLISENEHLLFSGIFLVDFFLNLKTD